MSAVRAAIYARFSSDLQRATSLADQVAVARRYAEGHAWHVLDPHIYTDAALSGTSLDRPGMQALLAAVDVRPLQFDLLLVDDSSRVARDLADAVRFMQQLTFAGVRVIYISQAIDSASDQAETLVAVHGMVDGLFIKEMAAKIRRGLAGQLQRGFATGASTYGYTSIPVPDPSGKTDANGYPLLLGKRVEIHPAEARVVVQIFEWFASGLGATSIVDRLNGTGVAGPRGGRWKHGAVKRLVANERYTGLRIWGQRRFERRPGTRQKVARAVPRDQWQTLDRPDLRIIRAELWARAVARRAAIRQALPVPVPGVPALMRGRHAALYSKHLFSGFLRCGVCGGAVSAVASGSGSPRYGCSSSHHNGISTCPNRLTIRAKVADPLLLAGLRRELLNPETVRYVSDRLAAALNALIEARPEREAETRAARDQAQQRLHRLVAAIESGVSPLSLSAAIVEREAEVRRLDADLADYAEPLRQRLAVMPTWVAQQLRDLVGLLTDTPARTKTEFLRLGLSVVMHPIRDDGARAFYRAIGHAALPSLAGTRDLMLPVDRLHPQSADRRTPKDWGFQVDLPASLPCGPQHRRRAG